jgi:hypothetical protein
VFSVLIAGGVFAVSWNSRGFSENNYLLFLGIAYLFVGEHFISSRSWTPNHVYR